MEVAAAELKDGGDNSAEEIEELSGSSSEDSTSADSGEDGVENNWIDTRVGVRMRMRLHLVNQRS